MGFVKIRRLYFTSEEVQVLHDELGLMEVNLLASMQKSVL
jgi:hypothetical protein